MSMTPDQICDLGMFGELPAETNLSAVQMAFADGSIHRNFKVLNESAILQFGNNTQVTMAVDETAKLSSYVSPSMYCKVLAIVQANVAGTAYFVCKYTDSLDTSVTTKTVSNGGDNYSGNKGGGCFMWTVTQTNFTKNAKFEYGIKFGNLHSGNIYAKCTLIGFPIEYGHTVL